MYSSRPYQEIENETEHEYESCKEIETKQQQLYYAIWITVRSMNRMIWVDGDEGDKDDGDDEEDEKDEDDENDHEEDVKMMMNDDKLTMRETYW